MNWIDKVSVLRGDVVELLPMKEEHLDELSEAASHREIWHFTTFNGSDKEAFRKNFFFALSEKNKGNRFPFVIFYKPEKKLIGSTSLIDYQPQYKKVEIGATWLHPDHWASEVNLECKLLLLTYCFDQLQTVRVQFKTDENNIRSRRAIEKIGGHFEGILRNDMIRDNNTKRNSAYFSITDEEWPDKKSKLIALCNSKRS